MNKNKMMSRKAVRVAMVGSLVLSTISPMMVYAQEDNESTQVVDDNAGKPSYIQVDSKEIFLKKKGDSQTINVTFSPGTTDKELVWSTWSDDMVSISSNAEGTITITALTDEEGWTCVNIASKNNPGVTAQIEVNLGSEATPEYPSQITLNTDIRTFLVQGESGKVWLNGYTQCTNKNLVWSSSDEKVATVDQNGNVAAVGAGKVTITGTSVGKNEDMEKPASDSITFEVYGKSEKNEYTYATNENGITLEEYIGSSTEVIIPSQIDGKKVTCIGQYAFGFADNAEEITKVTIPDTVETIDNYAFNWCKKLKDVNIPSSVKKIGKRAFCNTALESVTIPESVTSIGNEAFSDCKNLNSVILPKKITSIGANAFNGAVLKTIQLPDNIIYVGTNAFKGIEKVIVNKGTATEATLKKLSIEYEINNAPEIQFKDVQIEKGTKFDVYADVIAKDVEDGDLTSQILVVENNYKDEIGEYKIIYQVTDVNGLTTNKTRLVKVVEKKNVKIDSDKNKDSGNQKKMDQSKQKNKKVNTGVQQNTLMFTLSAVLSTLGYLIVNKVKKTNT